MSPSCEQAVDPAMIGMCTHGSADDRKIYKHQLESEEKEHLLHTRDNVESTFREIYEAKTPAKQ